MKIIEHKSEMSLLIKELIDERKYIKIQYFNEFHEFHTVYSLVKTLDGSSIELANGLIVKVSFIVSLDDRVMFNYSHIIDFTCDC